MALCPANTLTDLRPGNFLISTQPSGKQRAWKAAIRTGRMGRSGTGRRYRGCRRGRRMQATTLKTKCEPQGSCSPLHMLGSAPSPCHAHSPHAAAATYAAPCASHTCTLILTAPFAEALILAWAFMSNETRGHKCWYLKIRCGASGVAPPRGFVICGDCASTQCFSTSAGDIALLSSKARGALYSRNLARRRNGLPSFHQPFSPP